MPFHKSVITPEWLAKHPKYGNGRQIRTSREPIIIPAVQKILEEHDWIIEYERIIGEFRWKYKILREGTKMMVRQLMYILLSRGIIHPAKTGKYADFALWFKNRAYQTVEEQMIIGRRDGRIPYEVFIDKTCEYSGGNEPNPKIFSPEKTFDYYVTKYEESEETFRDSWKNYYVPYWYGQKEYVEVAYEKLGMKELIEPICRKYGVGSTPFGGYSSLTVDFECVQRLNQVPENHKIIFLYFGDWDMRGENIEVNLKKHLLEAQPNLSWVDNIHVIRCAITKEQIAKYKLMPLPAKRSDTMYKKWVEKEGNVGWEIEALDPKVLQKVVEKSILEHLDKNILKKRGILEAAGEQDMKRRIAEYFNEDYEEDE